MKRALLFLILSASAALAQGNGPPPTGGCNASDAPITVPGIGVYACKGGLWTLVSPVAPFYPAGPILVGSVAPVNPCVVLGERYVNTTTEAESFCGYDDAWHAGGSGTGTVNSVAALFPVSLFSPTGCNATITTSGTFSCGYATGQTANLIMGTDGSGNVGFMNLTITQLPSAASILSYLGTIPATNLPTATSGAKGIVQTDGSTISVSAGVISCTTGTGSQIGCLKPDNSTITVTAGVLSAVGGGGNVSAGAALSSGNVVTGAGTTAVQDSGVAIANLATASNTLTLTGKTISGASNTITNIPNSALANAGVTSINGTNCTLGTPCSVSGSGGLSPPASLKGTASAATGSTVTGVVELLADLYDSGNNGFANALTAASTNQSIIVAAAAYTGTDQIPCMVLDPNQPTACTTPATALFGDERYGHPQMGNNYLGMNYSKIYSPNAWQFNLYRVMAQGAIYAPLYILENTWNGGSNIQDQSLGYFNKTTYNASSMTNYSHTPGQHIGMGVVTNNYTVGDAVGITNYLNCWGGFNAQADEGCEAQDNQVFMGNVAYQGTLTGSPATGATSVTVSPSQGSGTQGAQRYFMDVTRSTTGTASALTSANGSPAFLTGTFTASTAYGTIGTNVTAPGSATVTPTFSHGTISAITTSSVVCAGDGVNEWECVKPTAVTGSTFTANWVYPHESTSIFSVGGYGTACMDINADDVTDAGWTAPKNRTITGTLIRPWPILYTTSTNAYLYTVAGGVYQQLYSSFDASAANGYTIYPCAQVASVQQNGGLSNTLTLSPNTVAWTAGDTGQEPLSAPSHIGPGYALSEGYFSNMGTTTEQSFGWTYNQIMHDQDIALHMTVNMPSGLGSMHGGKYTEPFGAVFDGPAGYNYGIQFRSPVKFATVVQQCDTSISSGNAGSCTGVNGILAAANASYFDFVTYDAANKQWKISYNSNSGQYTFGSSNFYGPGFQIPSGLADGCLDIVSGVFTSTGSPCGSGGLPATPGTSGISYTLVATPTGPPTSTYAATAVTTIPTCAANIAAAVSGPCVSGKGALVNGSSIRPVSGTTDTLLQTDWNNLVSYTNSGTVNAAIPQPGVGGNFEAGYMATLANNGSGSDIFTPSGGATINGASAITLAAGKSCVLRDDGTNYLCN